MKIDIGNQNERLINNIEGINSKIDQLFTSVNDLKYDNERLRQDNEQLREEMHFMKQKLDQIENQSRRNNLRFNGIHGNLDEKWDISEAKIRSFLKETLNLGEQADAFEIERAHRIKSRHQHKCTKLVKCVKYKDCEQILNRANTLLQKNRAFSVQQDYSYGIRQQRKHLGERMMAERSQGNYSVIRYDKLIINDTVYKYSDTTQSIVTVGKRRSGFRPRAFPHGLPNSEPNNNITPEGGLDSNHVIDDTEARVTPSRNQPIELTTEDDIFSDESVD